MPNILHIKRSAKEGAQDGLSGAELAAWMVDECGHPVGSVIATLETMGEGPTGCGPEVEEQIAVDDFRLIHSFEDWSAFADGSILSPDGTEYHAANDIDRAAADQVASDRDDALDAQFDARIGDLREIERGEI